MGQLITAKHNIIKDIAEVVDHLITILPDFHVVTIDAGSRSSNHGPSLSIYCEFNFQKLQEIFTDSKRIEEFHASLSTDKYYVEFSTGSPLGPERCCMGLVLSTKQCPICNKAYVLTYCCDGQECNCQGLPQRPLVCSKKCEEQREKHETL